MNTASKSKADMINGYVRQLRVRSSLTRQWYANEIRAFYRFLARTTPDGRPTEVSVVEWIRERLTEVTEIVVYDRARKIHGYLQYLVKRGYETHNPLAQLCERHGERSLAPILRAAGATDPVKAFAALCKTPPWSSSLGPIMRDHVALMRAVGYRYRAQEGRYRSFDRFLQRQPELAGQPLEVLIEAWTGVTPTKAHAGQCELVGRLLSRFMHRLDPGSPPIDVDRRLRRRLYSGHRRPYIYSNEELARLLAAARALETPRSPLLPCTVYTMIVLAYCAALRLGELGHLTVGDVDVPSGLLTVRNTKFFKSRRLPLDLHNTGA